MRPPILAVALLQQMQADGIKLRQAAPLVVDGPLLAISKYQRIIRHLREIGPISDPAFQIDDLWRVLMPEGNQIAWERMGDSYFLTMWEAELVPLVGSIIGLDAPSAWGRLVAVTPGTAWVSVRLPACLPEDTPPYWLSTMELSAPFWSGSAQIPVASCGEINSATRHVLATPKTLMATGSKAICGAVASFSPPPAKKINLTPPKEAAC